MRNTKWNSHISQYAPGYTSQTHPNGPKTFTDDELIDAFFASYSFWVFRYGEKLQDDVDAGFAILLLMYPYFQMIGRYIRGKRSNDPEEFEIGILSVFNVELINETIVMQKMLTDYLYKNLRCELAHGHLMGKGLVLSDQSTCALTWNFNLQTKNLDQIVVNPRLWVQRVGEHINLFKHAIVSDSEKKALFLKYTKSHIANVSM